MIAKNRLKEFRIRKGLSQNELAHLSNLSQNTISSLENYVYYPTLKNALMICKALECKVEDLFYLEEEKEATHGEDEKRVIMKEVVFKVTKDFIGNSLIYNIETKDKLFEKYNISCIDDLRLFVRMKNISDCINSTNEYIAKFEME